MAQLNPKAVEHLSKPGKHPDGEGLYLVVSNTGSKSWLLRYQLNGKRRDMGLGSYPAASLKTARLAAADARTWILKGIDPVDHRKAEQNRQREQQQADKARTVTFKVLALDYLKQHGGTWSAGWQRDWLSMIERYTLPVIGSLPPSEIETEHVLRILQPVWGLKPKTATRLRAQIESVLDAAKALKYRAGDNPARWRGHLDNLLSRADKKRATQHRHMPALEWRDLPVFMLSLAGLKGRDPAALRLLFLTAARSHMVRFATWSEFDLKSAVWHLPAERMKTRQEFTIPLSVQALELLQSLPRIEGSQYLFPGQGRTNGVIHKNAFFNLLRSMKYGDITAHGFRTTFRTWASECTHYPREVCELALAHDARNQTEAAYSRSNLLEKRRELMQAWADYVTSVPDSNVIHASFGV